MSSDGRILRPIVDKNGVRTHRWVNPTEGGGRSAGYELVDPLVPEVGSVSAPDAVKHVVAEIEDQGADSETLDRAKTLVGRTPALVQGERSTLLRALNAVVPNDSRTARDVIERLSGVDMTPTIERDPVRFPALSESHTRMWHTVMDMDSVGVPWALVGGNMVTLHCLEHGRPRSRATDDGDVVVDVWTHRSALRKVTRRLMELGYTETDAEDSLGNDGNVGFKYLNGASRIDVLVPENLDRQRVQPRTARGSDGMSAVGANRALIRTERVPILLAGRTGYVRRPSLIGALTIKSRAALADRKPDRHIEDVAELLALVQPLRRNLRAEVGDKDRHFYRRLVTDGAVGGDQRRLLLYLIGDRA